MSERASWFAAMIFGEHRDKIWVVTDEAAFWRQREQAAAPWATERVTRWSLSGEGLLIEAQGDMGHFARAQAVRYEPAGGAEVVPVGLDGRWMQRLLDQAGGEQVALHLPPSTKRPVRIVAEDGRWRSLLMPVHLWGMN